MQRAYIIFPMFDLRSVRPYYKCVLSLCVHVNGLKLQYVYICMHIHIPRLCACILNVSRFAPNGPAMLVRRWANNMTRKVFIKSLKMCIFCKCPLNNVIHLFQQYNFNLVNVMPLFTKIFAYCTFFYYFFILHYYSHKEHLFIIHL